MRLGADLHRAETDPASWVARVRELGLSTVIWPLDDGVDDPDRERDFLQAATAAGLTIAEVGAWCNATHPDPALRRQKIARCQERLALADRLGARCCVNVGGSTGGEWWGPAAADLSEAHFDQIIASVREIVDAVRPTRTVYALETMPWMHPDSPEAYRRLLQAIDRPGQVGAHLDPSNLIHSPRRLFDNAAFIRHCFDELGPWIRSCHAKDVRLHRELTVHLEEVPPGQGEIDYLNFLRCCAALDPETSVIIEHCQPADLPAAIAAVRQAAATAGVSLA